MSSQPLYKIFYINKGKFFLTRSWLTNNPKTAITNKHPSFKEEVGLFTAKEITKLMKQASNYEIWDVCDEMGKQYVKPKWKNWDIEITPEGKIVIL